MPKRIVIWFLAVFTLAGTPAGFAGETLQRVIDFKVVKVGMSADQAPMNMLGRDQQLMGFDVDLAKALAGAMRVKLEIKAMPFGDLMNALEQGQVDMVISGMAITPERSEHALFVGPYMMSGKSMLTTQATMQRISSEQGVNRADLSLVALEGSTSVDFLREAAPEAQVLTVDHYDAGVAMILSGEADGMIADMPACVLSIRRFPDEDLVTLEEPLNIEPIGIAIGKGDAEFHNLVDNYLTAYERTGVLGKLRKKWLEDTSWLSALPGA